MAVDNHYENFPVASWLIPREKRAAVAALYRFARGADDLADEGDETPAIRLTALAAVLSGLDDVYKGKSTNNVTAALAQYFRDESVYAGSHSLLAALISAFQQDVVKTRYATRSELLDYANRSANPVGRMMLKIFDVRSESAARASDAICTALQLINFWQDASIDIAKGRIYVPQEEFAKHGCDESAFPSAQIHRALMKSQCEHANAMLWSGCSLLRELSGRFRYEIAFTIAGGARILEKISANNYDVTQRPTLSKHDAIRLTWLALSALRRSKHAPVPDEIFATDVHR